MFSHSGEGPSETEAVGEEDVGALHSEFVAVVFLSESDIAHQRFYRGDVNVVGIPARTGDMPAARFDKVLHLFILLRVIFFKPCVVLAALEVEYIIGEMGKQEIVAADGIPEILADGGLNRPVPLSVEMGVSYGIYLRLGFCLFFSLTRRGCEDRDGGRQCAAKHHCAK